MYIFIVYILCTGLPITKKRMHCDRLTRHKHASVCAKDFWFCVLLEAWARGKYPGKEGIMRKIGEVESFINGLSNNSIQHFQLTCVPMKDHAPNKKPPRIALDEDGRAMWKYEVGESDNSQVSMRCRSLSGGCGGCGGCAYRPLPLEDVNASGVATPGETSYSLTKMAAYVKAVTAIGSQVYSKCIRAANRKRKFDKEWEMKLAEYEVEGAVLSHELDERWKRRRIDQQWHMNMDEWQDDKRECQKIFEAWRSVMAKGSDAMEAIDGEKDNGDEDSEVVKDGDDGDDEASEDDEDDEGDDVSGEVGDENDDADEDDDADKDDDADEGVTRYFLRPRVARQQQFAAAARVDGGDGNDRNYDAYFDVSVSRVDDDDVAEDGDGRGGRVGCHNGCCYDTGE